jgi:integrase
VPKVKLTAAAVERLKPPLDGQVDYFDQALPGFGLRITAKGVRSYFCFYRVAGKLVRHTLGRHSALSLGQARLKAGAIFDAVGEGRDPRLEKQEREDELLRSQGDTYAAAVDDFIAKHAIAKKGNRRHREQRRLLLSANQRWHKRPITSIKRGDIHDVLDKLVAEKKGYTANRVYEALHTFWKWLYQRDRVPENILAKIDRPFDNEEPRKRTWSDNELKLIWKASDRLDDDERIYLRLLLLLGQRHSEIAGMRWDELDLEAATWSLPADRAKGKRVHTFPLPALALQLIESLPKGIGNPFVFPGSRGTREGKTCPKTVGTKLQRLVQQTSGVRDFTFHDARRTFRTGLDRLHILPHIKDECLNHARRSIGDRHYSTYDYLDEQRSAFETWSRFVTSLVEDRPPGNIVEMGTSR